jgi:TonB family protein
MALTQDQMTPREPRLPQWEVGWEPRGRALRTSLAAFLGGPRPPRNGGTNPYFRDSWVKGYVPRGAIFASLLWHVAAVLILLLPIWKHLNLGGSATLAPVRIELTWYEPAGDLPPLAPKGAPAKPSPPGDPKKPLRRRGADAYHPRQTMMSLPAQLTHPRQTLIQPGAPTAPPKIEPQLPNMVVWAQQPQPAQPRLHIDPAALAPLRRHRSAPVEAAVPEVANLEKTPGQLNIAASDVTNRQPKLPMSPSAAANVQAARKETEAGPAPEIGPNFTNGDPSLQRLIALSSTPGPVAPTIEVPQGNLAARVTISPEGTQPGVPGGSANGSPDINGGAGGGSTSPGGTGGASGTSSHAGGGGGGSSGPAGLTVTPGGANPSLATGGGGGAGGSGTGGIAPSSVGRHVSPGIVRAPEKSQPAGETNPPRAPSADRDANIAGGLVTPEKILGDKRIYTVYVNMPNLTSATGSWVLNFAELHGDETIPLPALPASDLSTPEPVRKVDPRYPPELIHAHVEGEVVLYAIIRRDGSVDSIQVLKSVDPALDENAMKALARWRFRPASRRGEAIEVEAVVHIPFRISPPL